MTMDRSLRTLTRAAAVIATTGLVALTGADVASAHVSAQPSTAVKGSTGEITFRVPDEDAHASTVKVDVTLPLDHPIASVSTKALPGWTAQVTKAKLDKPVRTENGAQLTEVPQTITWTAQPGAQITPGQFQEFTIMASTLPDTDKLVMPTTQTYDNGNVVQWNQPPAAPGADEPEHPAPAVTLAANSTAAQGMSDMPGMANPASTTQAAQASPATSGQDSTARWLGGIAVALAAIGLGIALGAVLRGRRPTS